MSLMVVGLFLFGLAALQGQPGPLLPGQGAQIEPKVERKEADMRQMVAADRAQRAALSEAELNGRSLFTQRCEVCHNRQSLPQVRSMGPWLDREIFKTGGDAHIRQVIASGSPRMPGFQYSLSPAQIDEVTAFLKTLSPDQKPKPRGRP